MRRARSSDNELGQAAVETALVLPLQLFVLLGTVQLALAYQARLLSEYAVYKTARAASLYRLDCPHMVRAATMALLPTVSRTGSTGNVQQRFVRAATAVVAANRPPNFPAAQDVPLVIVNWRLIDRQQEFDHLLEPDEPLQRVHVTLAYFIEYRMPFVNQVMSRFWLMAHGMDAFGGADPIMPARKGVPAQRWPSSVDQKLVEVAAKARDVGYFTVPIVTTFSLRMMSDPPPNSRSSGTCQ